MDNAAESHRIGTAGPRLLPILKASLVSGLLATLIPACIVALVGALPTGLRADTSTSPSILDLSKVALLLCLITVVSCGPFGFLAGAAGSAWLRFRKRRIRSIWRLLVEATAAGFLCGLFFPFFDSAVASPHFQKVGALLNPLQLLLCPVVGMACAWVCALVFRKHFMQERIQQSGSL